MRRTLIADMDVIPAFSVRQPGYVGQEIIDADGRIIAWATDPWAAQVISKLLNDNRDFFLLRKSQ